MTENHAFKQRVRQFAALNDVSYTTALREFDMNGKLLHQSSGYRMTEQQWKAERVWSKRYGLRRNWDGGICFARLAQDGNAHRHGGFYCIPEDDDITRFSGSFTDHASKWTAPSEANTGRRQLAVLAFAPYRNWDNDRVTAPARRLADFLGLRVRFGFTADDTYGNGALPVVFWNPRVVDLQG